jgi:pyridoxal phosphate enzyme (YggS family)
MGHISQTIKSLHSSLPQGVELVAVSKFHPAPAILEAYEAGQRVFGESRATELVDKAKALPTDIKWHFIGHLQTNKVRMIMPHVSLIQSVDSERLLRLINAEAARIDRTIDVLLQVHVAQEETKFGFTPDELLDFAGSDVIAKLANVRVIGVMGMATNTEDEARIKADFNAISQTYQKARLLLKNKDSFTQVSMGMSDDYLMAIEAGSTMVRIGSTIFGNRQY